MKRLALGLVAVAALGLSAALVVPAPSNADSAPLYTHIATPTDGTVLRDPDTDDTTSTLLPAYQIAGTASPGVAEVTVYCEDINGGGSNAVETVFAIAAPVPVDPDGDFSTMTSKTPDRGCRLRALPDGTALTDNLAPFSGPVVYGVQLSRDLLDPGQPRSSTNPVIGFQATGSEGDGFTTLEDSACGVQGLHYSPRPALRRQGSASICSLGLGTEVGELVVDGRDALLPGTATGQLVEDRHLDAVPPAVSVTLGVASNGDETLTSSEDVVRCNGAGSYKTATCTQLVPVGVRLERTMRYVRDGLQVQVRDSFVSTDGRPHALHVGYSSLTQSPQPGYLVPGHGTGLASYGAATHLTGFGSGSRTLLVRYDRYASANDEQVATDGLTWSRPPASIDFVPPSSDDTRLLLSYGLTVPAHGRTGLGFAFSESAVTAQVVQLGRDAAAAMVTQPAITSPRPGATSRSRRMVVTGSVAYGANGLPIRVTVNGHRARITATSATSVRFRAVVPVARGTHPLTVVAHDSAGNSARRTLRVRRR